MNYRLRLASSAQADLESILDWIAERSIQGAVKWLESYEKLLTRLVEHPFAHHIAPENECFDDNVVRSALFGTPGGRVFRALYYVHDDCVIITHFRGPHQQPVSPQEF